MNKFFGTGVAMATPFQTDGQVDYNALRDLINYLIDGGVEYLVSLGTTGESVTLSKDEKKKVWAFTAEVNNGRVPLVAGIGGNNTYEVVNEVKSFDTTGYDAILSASPNYNKPTQEGIYQHYKAIAEASPLPVILYNVPSRTGSNVSAETTVRLAQDFKNIIGMKEASGNFDQLNQIMRDKPEDFLLISGDDPISLPMIALGGAGVISVVGNALPRQFSDMIRLCLKGDFKSAQKGHSSMIEFTRMMFAEGSPAGVKTALKALGVCGDTVRLPLVQVSSTLADKIIKETQKLDQIKSPQG
ncbi:4-hydroxy-tetrahydrodipicolinate synthase [Mucilaginibacter sp.]|jgi:4-hydroxy-tetrahydrodipicolinate synthase|uniref:4-hydroxy-tetrahydrodipicolinate synthase n=1 Tax=Mucilaginibacter sp. TaxID=1882438 RepID=UPI002CF16BC5|nr:4-hydroxy-tetrahydrodipicolinate synthase [Mucilaginibacter sp.]HTI60999.1 4-hydroxy-tetrahydrodipicolinate synthase [Mucilaginibacter sp.]